MSGGKYTVVLLNNGGKTSNKVNIVKIVLHNLNISMREAKDLVDSAPCVLVEDASHDIASVLKQEIEKNGGMVNLLEIEQPANENVSFYENEHENIKTEVMETDSAISKIAASKSNDGVPRFEAPGQSSDMPSFVSPSKQSGVPVFASPKNNSKAPVFASPNTQGSAPSFATPEQRSGAPIFNVPGTNNNAPTFTTPEQRNNVPTFSSHSHQHYGGESCAYHPNNRAVIKCNNCERPICDPCRETGKLTDGSYVCYDCSNAMVQNDVDIAKAKRSKIILKIVLGIVGAVIFGFISSTSGFAAFWQSGGDDYPLFLWQMLFTLFGASLSIYFPALKTILVWIWRFIRWKPRIFKANIIVDYIFSCIKFMLVIFAIVGFFMVFSIFLTFSPVVALVLAIVDIIRYIRANNLVKRNQELLQHLADRMEYIRIQSEENTDNETLANDSRMQNNQFAQAIRREGYASASKTFTDEAQEMAENDRKIKKFVLNEYGEAVRVA